MERKKLVKALKELINKEQELYGRYTELADEIADPEFKEMLGHNAYEEFTHLNALLDRYKAYIDQQG
jgi:rubrerythrin